MEPDIREVRAKVNELLDAGASDAEVVTYLRQSGIGTIRSSDDDVISSWNQMVQEYDSANKPNPLAVGAAQALEGASMGAANLIPGVSEYLRAGEEAYPKMSFGLDVAGGIGSALLLNKVQLPAQLSRLNPLKNALFGPAQGLRGAVRQGAQLGAIEGFTRSDPGLVNRLGGAGFGAGAGAVAAPVVGGLLRAAGGARNTFGIYRAGKQGTREADRALGAVSAVEAIQGPFKFSPDPIGAVEARARSVLDDAGKVAPVVPPAVYLGDVGQGIAVGVAQGGSRELAEETATNAIGELTGTRSRPGLLMQALAEAIGVNSRSLPESGMSHALSLKEATAKIARDTYRSIFKRNVTASSPEADQARQSIVRLMRQNAPAFERASRWAEELFAGPDMIFPRVTGRANTRQGISAISEGVDGFTGGDTIEEWVQNMTLEQAHRVRQGLSRLEQEAIRSGDEVALSQYTPLRQRFAAMLDQVFPEYGGVRARVADQHTVNEAFDAGLRHVSRAPRNLDEAARIRDILQSDNPEVKRMFVLGALSDVMDNVIGRANLRNTSNPASWLQNNADRFDRLRTLFPGDQEVDTFLRELAAAFEVGAQPQRLVGGSQTRFNQAANEQVVRTISEFVQGAYNPLYGVMNSAARMIRNEMVPSVRDATYRGLSDIMFDPQFAGPSGADRLFGLLRNTRAEQAELARRTQNLWGVGGRATGILGGGSTGAFTRDQR